MRTNQCSYVYYGFRCTRAATERVGDGWYCRAHARIVRASMLDGQPRSRRSDYNEARAEERRRDDDA